MDISMLTNISSSAISDVAKSTLSNTEADKSFDSVLQSAMTSLEQTSTLQESAESAELDFALGNTDNAHDLAIAQEKANVALQYTVAVRDKFIDAYNDIMNIQI